MGTSVQQRNGNEQKKQQFTLVIDDTETVIRTREKKKILRGADAAWFYVGRIGEIGFSIAIPVAGGALLGSVLDKQFASYPRATLSFLFLGIMVSFMTFLRSVQEIIKRTL